MLTQINKLNIVFICANYFLRRHPSYLGNYTASILFRQLHSLKSSFLTGTTKGLHLLVQVRDCSCVFNSIDLVWKMHLSCFHVNIPHLQRNAFNLNLNCCYSNQHSLCFRRTYISLLRQKETCCVNYHCIKTPEFVFWKIIIRNYVFLLPGLESKRFAGMYSNVSYKVALLDSMEIS